jgi:hypothetical protein
MQHAQGEAQECGLSILKFKFSSCALVRALEVAVEEVSAITLVYDICTDVSGLNLALKCVNPSFAVITMLLFCEHCVSQMQHRALSWR